MQGEFSKVGRFCWRANANARGVFFPVTIQTLILLSFCIGAFANQPTSPPRLALIRAAIADNIGSLRSLSLKYTLNHEVDLEHPHPKYTPRPDSMPPTEPLECEWYESGTYRLFINHPYKSGKNPASRLWYSIGEKYAYRVKYDSRDESRIESLYRTTDHSELAGEFGPYHPRFAVGKELPESDLSLLDLISKQSRWMQQEPIDGNVCEKLDLGIIGDPESLAYSLECWLDSKHDYVIRRLDYLPHGNSPSAKLLKEDGWYLRLTVKEIQSLIDNASKTKRWFPRDVAFSIPSVTWRFKVTHAELNPRLTLRQFQPDVPDGTTVITGPVISGQPYKIHIVGGKKALDAVVASSVALAAQSPRPITNATTFVNARQRPGLFYWVLWVTVCVALIITGGNYAWRR